MAHNSESQVQPTSSSSVPVGSSVGASKQPIDANGGAGLNTISDVVGKQPATEMGQNSRGSDLGFKRKKERSLSLWDRIKYRRCHKTPLAVLATRNTLLKFDVLCTELKNDGFNRVDQEAAKQIKRSPYFVAPSDIIGSVPGVEVGDEFRFRTAMSLIGLHKHQHAEVDFTKQDNDDDVVCTSVISSDYGGYCKKPDGREYLIFTSNAGASGKKQPEDQKLEGGILALCNSQSVKNPVRIIRGNRKVGQGGKVDLLYIYDGLYEVDSFRHERAATGKLVYKFELARRPGQPKITGNQWVKLGMN